jgi:hypothetical protein
MKRLSIAVLTSLVGMLITCPPLAHADPNDMRTGVFKGYWCGYSAEYHVDSKDDGDRWVFHGRLTFYEYPGLADELWIEQYGNNAMRMIRYLSGEQEGATQVVETLPPVPPSAGERKGVVYRRDFSHGVDCEGPDKPTNLFVEAIAEPPSTELPKLTDNIDIRSQPDFDSPLLGVVNRGTTVRVVERKNVFGTDWAHISFYIMTKEVNGWVESRFVP